jgi:Flp pilus assembly protein TadB
MSGTFTFALMGIACFAIAILVWAVIRGSKREGRAEAEAEAATRAVEETVSKVKAGAQAVQAARDAMAAGDTPAQIKARNDAAWAKKGANK